MTKRVAVVGCREYSNYEQASKYISYCIESIRKKYNLIFVSGGCRGADRAGERFALENGFAAECYPADWKTYGRAAGPIRNEKIAQLSDYIICFWDGKSKGTKSMIKYARKYNKPIRIIIVSLSSR